MNINSAIAKTYVTSNKKLTAVAVMGVVLGMSIYIFMNCMLVGFDKSSSLAIFKSTSHIRVYKDDEISKPLIEGNNAKPIIINPKIVPVNNTIINPNLVIETILKQKEVTVVTPQVNSNVFYNNGKSQISGISVGIKPDEANLMFDIKSFMVEGNFELLKSNPNGIVIGSGISEKMNTEGLGFKTFRMNELIEGFAFDNREMKYSNISEKEFKKYKLEKGDLLFNRTNSFEHVGRTGIFDLDGDYCFASYLIRLQVNRKKVDPYFLNFFMNTSAFQSGIKQFASRAIGQANINATSLKSYKIPLPDLPTQARMVAAIERERALVAGCRELMAVMEEKVRRKVAGVWGE